MSDVEGQEKKSEETTNEVVEQAPTASEELLTRLEKLESSNKRLLDESKTWKNKYQNVRSEVDERESEVLKQSNDFKGLYERSLTQVGELKEELQGVKMSSLDTSLKYEVARHGKDADDVEILLAAVKTKKRDLLSYDKDDKEWKGVDLAIEELRKTNAGLFKNTVPGMEAGRPNAIVPKDKTVDELIDEDPMAVLRESLAKML